MTASRQAMDYEIVLGQLSEAYLFRQTQLQIANQAVLQPTSAQRI